MALKVLQESRGSPFLNEIPFQEGVISISNGGRSAKPLNSKSKYIIIALVISGIAGVVIIGLGAASLFGPIGSTRFVASIAGGGIAIVVSGGGIIWIAMTHSQNQKRQENISINLERDPTSKCVASLPQEGEGISDHSLFTALAEKIRRQPPYKRDVMTYSDFAVPYAIPTRDFASIFVHAHEVLPHVYLGDYRGFLSVDPAFIAQYPMVDELHHIFNGNPSDLQYEWAINNLDFQGCADKNIRTVVSVTQFKSNATHGEWSTFQPDLERLNIHRIQIPVDDVDGAWEAIEPRLDEIFEQIDHAIHGGENLLVHCVKGASRSAAVIYAYLMNRCSVTLDEAYNYVVSIRHQAELKPSMINDLKHYEEQLQLRDANYFSS